MTAPIHDTLIVGAGPAGIQLAADLHRAGRDYLVLEGGEAPGTFFRTYPRHRTLISSNKVHTGSTDPEFNMRMDWNSVLTDDPDLLFTGYTERYFPPADLMVRYLGDVAERLGLNVRFGTRVERVEREDGLFRVTAADGSVHRGRRLVMATGVSKPYVPQIPGIEHAELYTEMTVDPKSFTDQRVLILGKGNSALETADNLIETAAVIHVAGPHSMQLAWRTHYVGHLRAVNNNFLDSYQLKSQNAILDGNALSIDKRDGGYHVSFQFTRADDVVKEIRYDRVLVCTGFRFDASVFADDCRPDLVIKGRFPDMTSGYESVNVPGLYFAGTITQMRDFKRSTSGFIHGFRYGARALGRILAERHEETAWPSRELPARPAELATALLERLCRTSALWQQFGHLGDVVVAGDGAPRYYEEVPVDYVHDGALSTAANRIVVTLEYGPDHDKHDPFDVNVRRIRQNDPGVADAAAYLHPVLRHYRDGEQVGEHHVAENLENEWDHPRAHHAPLAAFLAGFLGAGEPEPAAAGGTR
jgi:thioredoxin reductase